MAYQTIEHGRGMTYRNNEFVVYELSTYPRHSVLAGQQCRKWMASFPTLAEAQAAYPKARGIEGTSYRAPDLSHLSDGPDY